MGRCSGQARSCRYYPAPKNEGREGGGGRVVQHLISRSTRPIDDRPPHASGNGRIAAVVGAMVALNSIILLAIGTGFVPHLTAVVLLAYGAVCGMPVAYAVRRTLRNDPVALGVVATLSGLIMYIGLAYLLFHFPRWGLPIGGLRGACIVALVLMSPLAAVTVARWRLSRQAAPETVGASECRPRVDLVLLVGCGLMAIAVSAACFYGYVVKVPEGSPDFFSVPSSRELWKLPQAGGDPSNPPDIPAWGRWGDFRIHLSEMPEAIIESGGLPDVFVAHRGVPLMVMTLVMPVQDASTVRLGDTTKAVMPVLWFAVFYFLGFAAREVVGLSRGLTWLAAGAGALFAPINTPPWSSLTSYRGLFPSALSQYHNLTQLASIAIALPGLVLAGLALRRRAPGRSFVVGCALVGVSLFFKPSLYTAAAPALGVIWLLHPRRWSPVLVGGLVAAAIPAALWFLVGALTASNSAVIVFEPFQALLATRGDRLPGLDDQGPLLAAIVLLVTFAALAPALVDRIARVVRTGGVRPWRPSIQPHQWPQALLLTVLAFGLASGLLLNEPVREISGNVKWATGAGIVVALPVLIGFIARTSSTALRRTAWVLMAAHLGYGVHSIYATLARGTF